MGGGRIAASGCALLAMTEKWPLRANGRLSVLVIARSESDVAIRPFFWNTLLFFVEGPSFLRERRCVFSELGV